MKEADMVLQGCSNRLQTRLLKPDLFQTKNISCDIETTGELTRGTTIVDRRIGVYQPPNLEVVVDVDLDGVTDYLWTTLARAVP